MFASTSNVLDIKDQEQDAIDKINTVPVVYGPHSTYAISTIVAATALSLHGVHGLIDVAFAAFSLWCATECAAYDASST